MTQELVASAEAVAARAAAARLREATERAARVAMVVGGEGAGDEGGGGEAGASGGPATGGAAGQAGTGGSGSGGRSSAGSGGTAGAGSGGTGGAGGQGGVTYYGCSRIGAYNRIMVRKHDAGRDLCVVLAFIHEPNPETSNLTLPTLWGVESAYAFSPASTDCVVTGIAPNRVASTS